MKKLLISALLVSACAFAPAMGRDQAQDQGDPNPPRMEGRPRPEIKPALNEGTGEAPRAAAAGDTSGPAAGANARKENPMARKHASPAGVAGPSGMAAGSPGVEAKRGAQAGKEWLPPEELRKKPTM